MIVANYYKHCKEEWAVEDCDKLHNSHCPVCNRKIKPKTSVEKTENGEYKTHKHD